MLSHVSFDDESTLFQHWCDAVTQFWWLCAMEEVDVAIYLPYATPMRKVTTDMLDMMEARRWPLCTTLRLSSCTTYPWLSSVVSEIIVDIPWVEGGIGFPTQVTSLVVENRIPVELTFPTIIRLELLRNNDGTHPAQFPNVEDVWMSIEPSKEWLTSTQSFRLHLNVSGVNESDPPNLSIDSLSSCHIEAADYRYFLFVLKQPRLEKLVANVSQLPTYRRVDENFHNFYATFSNWCYAEHVNLPTSPPPSLRICVLKGQKVRISRSAWLAWRTWFSAETKFFLEVKCVCYDGWDDEDQWRREFNVVVTKNGMVV